MHGDALELVTSKSVHMGRLYVLKIVVCCDLNGEVGIIVLCFFFVVKASWCGNDSGMRDPPSMQQSRLLSDCLESSQILLA